MKRNIRFNRPYSVIPVGQSCTTIRNGEEYVCPYWEKLPMYPDSLSGYCHFLGVGDVEKRRSGMEATLHEKIKKCNVNFNGEDRYIFGDDAYEEWLYEEMEDERPW